MMKFEESPPKPCRYWFEFAPPVWLNSISGSPIEMMSTAMKLVRLANECPAEVILDVAADDVCKSLLCGGQGERDGAVGVKIPRPAADDAGDRAVRLAPDSRGDGGACDRCQRADLLPDRCRQSGHVEIAPRPDQLVVERRRMDEKANRRARRGVPVAHAFRHRQGRRLAGKRLANDV